MRSEKYRGKQVFGTRGSCGHLFVCLLLLLLAAASGTSLLAASSAMKPS